MMAVPPSLRRRRCRERDAGEDYLESHPKAAGVRVRRHPARRGGRAAAPRDRIAPSSSSPAAVLGVSAARPGLRHPGAASLRVRALVGARGLLSVRPAPRAVSHLRRAGRGDPLGRGQASAHHDLRLVSGRLGQTAELDGGGRGVRHDLGPRVSGRRDGRAVGAGASGPDGDHGDRHRRVGPPPRAPLRDPGVSTRPELSPVALDRARPQDAHAAGLLPLVRPSAHRSAPLRVQRHVEAVPAGRGQEGRPRHPRAGSVPHHGPSTRRSTRSGPRRRARSRPGAWRRS